MPRRKSQTSLEAALRTGDAAQIIDALDSLENPVTPSVALARLVKDQVIKALGVVDSSKSTSVKDKGNTKNNNNNNRGRKGGDTRLESTSTDTGATNSISEYRYNESDDTLAAIHSLLIRVPPPPASESFFNILSSSLTTILMEYCIQEAQTQTTGIERMGKKDGNPDISNMLEPAIPVPSVFRILEVISINSKETREKITQALPELFSRLIGHKDKGYIQLGFSYLINSLLQGEGKKKGATAIVDTMSKIDAVDSSVLRNTLITLTDFFTQLILVEVIYRSKLILERTNETEKIIYLINNIFGSMKQNFNSLTPNSFIVDAPKFLSDFIRSVEHGGSQIGQTPGISFVSVSSVSIDNHHYGPTILSSNQSSLTGILHLNEEEDISPSVPVSRLSGLIRVPFVQCTRLQISKREQAAVLRTAPIVSEPAPPELRAGPASLQFWLLKDALLAPAVPVDVPLASVTDNNYVEESSIFSRARSASYALQASGGLTQQTAMGAHDLQRELTLVLHFDNKEELEVFRSRIAPEIVRTRSIYRALPPPAPQDNKEPDRNKNTEAEPQTLTPTGTNKGTGKPGAGGGGEIGPPTSQTLAKPQPPPRSGKRKLSVAFVDPLGIQQGQPSLSATSTVTETLPYAQRLPETQSDFAGQNQPKEPPSPLSHQKQKAEKPNKTDAQQQTAPQDNAKGRNGSKKNQKQSVSDATSSTAPDTSTTDNASSTSTSTSTPTPTPTPSSSTPTPPPQPPKTRQRRGLARDTAPPAATAGISTRRQSSAQTKRASTQISRRKGATAASTATAPKKALAGRRGKKKQQSSLSSDTTTPQSSATPSSPVKQPVSSSSSTTAASTPTPESETPSSESILERSKAKATSTPSSANASVSANVNALRHLIPPKAQAGQSPQTTAATQKHQEVSPKQSLKQTKQSTPQRRQHDTDMGMFLANKRAAPGLSQQQIRSSSLSPSLSNPHLAIDAALGSLQAAVASHRKRLGEVCARQSLSEIQDMTRAFAETTANRLDALEANVRTRHQELTAQMRAESRQISAVFSDFIAAIEAAQRQHENTSQDVKEFIRATTEEIREAEKSQKAEAAKVRRRIEQAKKRWRRRVESAEEISVGMQRMQEYIRSLNKVAEMK